jgi:hypothetical protein
MTTFSYRSCPLNNTILTTHENEGWSIIVTIAHADLSPLRVKSQVTKRLCLKKKTNTSHHNGALVLVAAC